MKKEISIKPKESFGEWYERFISECRSIIVTKVSNSRLELIEGYHMLGKEIIENNDNFEREKIYGKDIVQRIADSLNQSTRNIYYAMQLFRKYPDLDLLPDGMNISWHKMVTKYLPDKIISKEDCTHSEYRVVRICKHCKKQIKEPDTMQENE